MLKEAQSTGEMKKPSPGELIRYNLGTESITFFVLEGESFCVELGWSDDMYVRDVADITTMTLIPVMFSNKILPMPAEVLEWDGEERCWNVNDKFGTLTDFISHAHITESDGHSDAPFWLKNAFT